MQKCFYTLKDGGSTNIKEGGYMKIPKKYKLLGHTVKVKNNKDLLETRGAIGVWMSLTNTIEVQPATNRIDIARSQVEHAFCHEVIHSWLTAMGEEELNANEKFVDQQAGLLHQFLVSYKL